MTARESLWRLLDRLTSFLPSPPDGRPPPSTLPDPNEPGISERRRRARLRLWLQRYDKGGKGAIAKGGKPIASSRESDTGGPSLIERSDGGWVHRDHRDWKPRGDCSKPPADGGPNESLRLEMTQSQERAASVEPNVVSVDVVAGRTSTVKSNTRLKIAGDDVAVRVDGTADGVRRGYDPDAALLRGIVSVIGRKCRAVRTQSHVVAGHGIAAAEQQDAVIREVADGQATDCGTARSCPNHQPVCCSPRPCSI